MKVDAPILVLEVREDILVLLCPFSLMHGVGSILCFMKLVIMCAYVLNIYWVLPSKVPIFNFSLLLYLYLEVIHKVAGVVLKVLEVEFGELVVVDIRLLSSGESVDFSIDVKMSTKPISIFPYSMALVDFIKLIKLL